MITPDDDRRDKRLSKMQPGVVRLLDCPVCFERITPPVTVCHNGHAVCNNCRKKLLSCPTCKAGFSNNKNTILDQIIEENIFKCKYSPKGCTTEMKLRDIEEHEQKQCKYRTIVCTIANPKNDMCNSEVSICEYYSHVNSVHKSNVELIDFSIETKRVVDIRAGVKAVRILKDAKTSRIVFEVIKIDKITGVFYITFVFIGTGEEANKNSYELRISNPKDKYRKLKYKSLCVPLGSTEVEMESSERCLILNTSTLPNFTSADQLIYSVRFEAIAKWYKKVGRRWTHGLPDDDNPGSEG